MISIIHCADLHLDSALSRYGEKAVTRQDLRNAFLRLAEKAAEEKTNIFLISGDLFDDESVTADTVNTLIRGFDRAKETRFFILPGNHDFYHSRSVYAAVTFPENVYIFKSGNIERVDIEDKGVSVYGLACTSQTGEKDRLQGFKADDPDRINIMLYHGDMGGKDDYSPVTKEQIANSHLTYLALGHIHSFSGIKREGQTYYAYPGCIQGRGFDECGDKGAIVGNLDIGMADLSFLKVSGKNFTETELCVTDCKSTAQIAEMIKDMGLPYAHPVRVNLVGQTEPSFSLSVRVIKEQLPEFSFIDIKDRTTLRINPEEYKNDRNLRGLFIAGIEKSDAPDTVKQKALRYGLSALAGEKEEFIYD